MMNAYNRRVATAMVACVSIPAMLMMAIPAKAEGPWTGFYVGLHGGFQQNDVEASSGDVTEQPGEFGPRPNPENDPDDGDTSNDFLNELGNPVPEADAVNDFFVPLADTPAKVIGSVTDNLDFDSFAGGAHVGYNYQMGSVVFGVEADLDIATGSGNASFVGPEVEDGNESFEPFANAEVEHNFQSSLRARLGWATDRTLVYATGGLAFAHFDYKVNAGIIPDGLDPEEIASKNFSDVAVGFTVGGGLEFLVTDNISFGAEYRYTDYGAVSTSLASVVDAGNDDVSEFAATPQFDHSSHAVQARLTYHFSY